ncbi:MAG: ATP-dependent Clp protease adaptor ClpS [Muribaculaceae bacterium]|nr:ATP-dependent Clp protease adaptor ClpS [Muribaculaceae bacterium]
MSKQETKHQTGGHTRVKIRPKKPTNYNVLFHNDDVTTMDFVVMLLMGVFGRPQEQAIYLMLKVHHEGKAVVGTYTYDIARSKTEKATRIAREAGFPLRITYEPNELLPF